MENKRITHELKTNKMKNFIYILIGGMLAGLVIVKIDKCNRTQTISIHSEKIREFHDTITRIKKEYQTQILTVQKSTRPDTFIRNFTDTVFGNHDSFIYVTVLKGQECCAEIPWKDSIINLDSVMMERSEKALKDCETKAKRKENSLKWTRRIYSVVVLGLVGVLVVK